MSIHLDYHTPRELRAILDGQGNPIEDEHLALELLCDAVEIIKRDLTVPLLLENMPQWPLSTVALDATPGFITRALERTGCDLLLDTSHARIAAALLGYENIQSYLEQLLFVFYLEALCFSLGSQ